MNNYNYENARWQKVTPPKQDLIMEKVVLTNETIAGRKLKLLQKLQAAKLDAIAVYADLEHGSNFEYISGFLPRFEEALLVLHSDGRIFYLLGNENLKLAQHAHHQGIVIHVPQFSLPNQPMHTSPQLENLLRNAGITDGQRLGVAGWKLFTGHSDHPSDNFDLPYFIIKAFQNVLTHGTLSNATNLFIGNNGVRTCNNANELVHYAFGSQLASKAILRTMDRIEPGKTEMEIAAQLDLFGQPKSVVTIAAAGQRFQHANLYPTARPLRSGEPLSLTIGYKGGLQSRTGYLCEQEEQLPDACADYMNRVVRPYFTAVTAWIENIRIGMKGSELYQLIEQILPPAAYGWSLNPGHLIATEEWMSSPVYEHSEEQLKSGMMLQIDIIPSVPGYPGISTECGIALADSQLKMELGQMYPEFLAACKKREEYLRRELGIQISPDVLILSNAVLYMRPFLLNKEYAMTYHRNQPSLLT